MDTRMMVGPEERTVTEKVAATTTTRARHQKLKWTTRQIARKAHGRTTRGLGLASSSMAAERVAQRSWWKPGITTEEVRSFPVPALSENMSANYDWRCLLEMQDEPPGHEARQAASRSSALAPHQVDNVRATFSMLTPTQRLTMIFNFLRFLGEMLHQVVDAAERHG